MDRHGGLFPEEGLHGGHVAPPQGVVQRRLPLGVLRTERKPKRHSASEEPHTMSELKRPFLEASVYCQSPFAVQAEHWGEGRLQNRCGDIGVSLRKFGGWRAAVSVGVGKATPAHTLFESKAHAKIT